MTNNLVRRLAKLAVVSSILVVFGTMGVMPVAYANGGVASASKFCQARNHQDGYWDAPDGKFDTLVAVCRADGSRHSPNEVCQFEYPGTHFDDKTVRCVQ